ncbi:MAG: amidase [Solirubrobacteraceae bacterium]
MTTVAARAAPARALTERSATDLAHAVRTGALSSRAVVEAHIERLQADRRRINAIAADRFDAALADADAADRRVAEAAEADDLPPLLGVPCTIKESIALAGMPNCAGLISRREHRATETATTAQRLIEAGAIPLGVTNTSELTMWIESANYVYGRTRNAYDPARVAGGSSGGEGAAVGSGGSPIGLGSDIGGSIRLPAFFNGVFGHKATSGLVPNTGQFPNTAGDAASMLSIGPLTRRAEDLMPVLRIIAGPDGIDKRCRAVKLGDPAEVALDGLDVVLSERMSMRPPSRDLRLARERAAAVLEAAGARVRRVALRSLRRALELYLAALQEGAGTTTRTMIEDEAEVTAKLALHRIGYGAFRRQGPHTVPLAILLGAEALFGRMPDRRTRRLLAAGRALTQELEAVIGQGVLLHPPHSRVAPRHGKTVGRPWVITPTAIFNLAGVPVTQIPLGLDDDGIPLGVQVAAGRERDHVAIAVALALERSLGGWLPPRA